MAHKGRKRRRLIRLWLDDFHCHWCAKPTFLMLAPGVQNFRHAPEHPKKATLDHLDSKLNNDRGKYKKARTVLACWQCNQDRCIRETEALGLTELQRRSGRGAILST